MPYVARLEIHDTMEKILSTGARRLSNSSEQERLLSLAEIVEIANERFDILLHDPNPIQREWQRG